MTTFKYGGESLTIINSKHHLVPKVARNIVMPPAYKKALAIAVKANMPALLIGEAGTGKTSAVRYLAYKLKQPYVRVNMTGFTSPDELIGSKSAANGSTFYEDGIITAAMKAGAILVLDEINATPPDSVFILHGLLDEDRQITMPNGDVIKPHPDFRVFATMNPEYEGTKTLNRAFLDRFPIILEMKSLEPTAEAHLLEEYYNVAPEDSIKMVTIAGTLRKAFREEKTITHVSTRSLLQWAELMANGMDRKLSYEVSIVRKATVCDQGAFMDSYNAVFKEKSSSNINPLDDPTPVITTAGEINRAKDRINTLTSENTKLNDKFNDFSKQLVQFKMDYQNLQDKLKETEEKLPSESKLRKLIDGTKAHFVGDITDKQGHVYAIGDIVMAKQQAPYSETTEGWKGVVIGYKDNLLLLANEEGGTIYTVSQDYFDKVEIQ